MLKRVTSSQFAGLHDIDISFNEGLNLFYGKNEAGKSTLIALIFSLLFQNTSLNMASKGDKAFKAAYFPTERLDGGSGDYIDGRIDLSSYEKEISVYKKWGERGRSFCEIVTENGRYQDPASAAKILGEKLKYGRGIFEEIIFANQKNREAVIRSLFSGESDMRKSLSEVLSKAMLETGGVSVEKLKNALDMRILRLGSKWNEDLDRPDGNRGIDNPWKKEVGEILEVYYAIKALERQLYGVKDYEKRLEDAGRFKIQLDKFLAIYPDLQRKKGLSNKLSAIKAEIEKLESVQKRWPLAEGKLKRAKELEKELKAAEATELLAQLDKLRSEYDKLKSTLKPISDEDVKTAKALDRNILAAKNKLMGMNLVADIKVLNGCRAEIKSLVDGRSIPMETGGTRLSESVKIAVDDILEMTLSPADIDLKSARESINSWSDKLSQILEKYAVKNTSELEEILLDQHKKRGKLDSITEKYRLLLGSRNIEDISISSRAFSGILKSTEEIRRDISELCKGKPLDAAIGALENGLGQFEQEYVCQTQLEKHLADRKAEQENLIADNEKIAALPREYAEISDPDFEYERIKNSYSSAQSLADDAKRRVTTCLSSEEITDEIRNKQADFVTKKTELSRWRHIQSVIAEVLNESDDKPLRAVESAFRQNLAILTGDSVTGSLNTDLATKVYSGGSKMSAEILSEGTKSSVSLAYRFAVIDWLYPDGGGFAVLDDPFTDMDRERCESACRLVKDFAKRHQVIYFTCDDKYETLLEVDSKAI